MRTLATFLLLAVAASAATAQQPRPAAPASEGIIMLEEIKIEVAPELPTVVVTIPRQNPSLQPLKLNGPVERMTMPSSSLVKPRLANVKISQIAEPEKILAKPLEK